MQPHLIMTSSGSVLSLILRVVPDVVICWVAAYLDQSWMVWIFRCPASPSIDLFLSLA